MPQEPSAVSNPRNGGPTVCQQADAEFDGRPKTLGTYLDYLLVLAQFVLILLVMQRFDIQTSGFHRVFYLAVPGFVINQFLPRRWRLPFFAALSIAGIFIVLGGAPVYSWDFWPATRRTALLLAVGGVLIGICHLPIGLWKRVALLVAAGGVIAVVRTGIAGGRELAAVWPVLAAMFMFRLFIYMYDLSTGAHRPRSAESIAYFFLLPNVALTLFPVVDFKTFCRSHFSAPPLEVYQKGIRWMTRGVLQLLLYRAIDQFLSLGADEVASGTDLIQFLITNLFLYVKVSGLFHLVVGLLLLFGFNLPETNHRYFLASSFTDYWRRVNIYWKDFMMKVFFYPVFFRLKDRGATLALVVATLFSFVVTWAMHLYQTWWLKGAASPTWPDTIFWLILGLLVLATALHEMKQGRQRKLPTAGCSIGDAVRLALRTAGVFACLCVLWSLWSTASVSLWLSLWTHADWHTFAWGLAVLAGIMVATILFEARPALRARPAAPATPRSRSASWYRSPALQSAVPLLVVYACVQPSLESRFTDRSLQAYWDFVNAGDSASTGNDAHGYYELLARPSNFDIGLQEVLTRQYAPGGYAGPWPIRRVKDYRFYEPLPSIHQRAYKTDYQTNRWGMRDRDYQVAKPADVVRIALLGSSTTMGFGVKEGLEFGSIIERRLNRTYRRTPDGARFEVMNFAVTGYSPLNQIPVLPRVVSAFKPDIVLLVIHSLDYDWLSRDLYRFVRYKIPIPDRFLQETLSAARVVGRTPRVLATERLKPYEPAVLAWTYKQLVEECRAIGALPVTAYVPLPDAPVYRGHMAAQMALAVNAGFVVLDLSTVFDGRNPRTLMLPEAFNHYTPAAHALIADALYKQLTSDSHVALSARATHGSARGSSASLTAHSDHAAR